ncbi:hypothetical protein [Streptomyces cavernicola]|uniref:Uncharacterized protein n=1 Tax=Streptomyces cavernicola TaxID=3043613 RepID=A0ABT6S573_9ACTN|nr:hypothetical protein [Streptomyces sp. B-S-A6]MDI3403247.1 hypothetical protein [Streptomyces sp. B-S-A6]
MTDGLGVRELAERYKDDAGRGGRTVWSEYRSGARLIPLGRLNLVVKDRVRDARGRQEMLAKARRLHDAALAAEAETAPAPGAEESLRQAQADLESSRRLVQRLLGIIDNLQQQSPAVEQAASGETRQLDQVRRQLTKAQDAHETATRAVADIQARLRDGVEEEQREPDRAEATAEAKAEAKTDAKTDAKTESGEEAEAEPEPEAGAEVADDAAGTTGKEERGPAPHRAGRYRRALIGASTVALLVAGAAVAGLLHQHRETAGAPPKQPGATPTAKTPSGAARTPPTPGPGVSATGPAVIGDPGRDRKGPADASGPLYAVSLDRSKVLRWTGEGTEWAEVGGVAGEIYAGGAGVFATDPVDGRIFRYDGAPGTWTYIGSAGAEFALGGEKLYALTPGRDAVMRYDRAAKKWTPIGGPAGHIYAGGAGLFATRPGDGHLIRRQSDGTWTRIGNPGASFAVGADDLYGLSPDRKSIFQWTRRGDVWTRIGGAADSLHAGGAGLFAVDSATGRIKRYTGTPERWTDIGPKSAMLSVGDRHVYRLASDRRTLWRWTGNGTEWTRVGGSAAAIASTD